MNGDMKVDGFVLEGVFLGFFGFVEIYEFRYCYFF